jgi:hypothetical protein
MDLILITFSGRQVESRAGTRKSTVACRALVDYFAVTQAHSHSEMRMNPKPTLTAELIAEFLGTLS